MAFKIRHTQKAIQSTPEELIRDLRGKQIQGLLSHQADIIRDYIAKALNASDVAFQLPTGSGKTLVGLLIGEWRRRKYNEQVLYLCPTNQLVNQVVEQSIEKYGIDAISFTGPKSEYTHDIVNFYLNAEKIAITSYSALFNIKPFFEEPDLIILDDIHTSENYIASNWSLNIDKYNQRTKALFDTIVSLLRDSISPVQYQALITESDERLDFMRVDKLSTPAFNQIIPGLYSIIDQYPDKDTNLNLSWQTIKNNLNACHFYYTSCSVLIRPIIPPTKSFAPFNNAKQRIYMSATLGEGGDLERLTGREDIYRLKVPEGWDRQGIGRRYFIFPERSLDEKNVKSFIEKAIFICKRALILVPDFKTADKISRSIQEVIGCPIYDASQIESSKKEFIKCERAVAVVANRYDGIDLIDDECRLLIINEIARATNLQERFFVSRMGAVALLNDRILTRIMQAIGRCTRSATDYAVVIVIGQELLSFFFKQNRRKLLHPELQAELEFGIDQSKSMTVDQFMDNIKVFLTQDKKWQEVDQDIIELRNTKSQHKMPGTDDLINAVKYEVRYQNALWNGDYLGALEQAKNVLTFVVNDNLRGYRALWLYLAGASAWLCTNKGIVNKEYESRELFKKAADAAQTLDWLFQLGDVMPVEVRKVSEQSLCLIERMELEIERLGTINNSKFESYVSEIVTGFNANNSKLFENAHVLLGKLLGYNAGNKNVSGAPDPWWLANDKYGFVFEDNSEAKDTSSICITKARQAATHTEWIKKHLRLPKDSEILSVLITPSKTVLMDSIAFLDNVYIWNLDEFKKWSLNAIGIIRNLRGKYPGQADLVWREGALQQYLHNNIDPIKLVNELKKNPANKLLTK